MDQQSFTLTEFEGEKWFLAFRQEWGELWEESVDSTQFQLWSWQYAYWKNITPDAVPHFFVLRNAAGRMRVIALLVCSRDPANGIKALGFVGGRLSDYNMLLSGNDVPVQEGRRLLSRIFGKFRWPFPSIKLLNVPMNSWTGQVLSDYLPDLVDCSRVCTISYGESHAVLLPKTIDDYVNSLSQRARRHFGYERRRLSQACRVEFKVFEKPDGLSVILDQIEKIDLARWGSESKYRRPARRNFERSFIESLAEAGKLVVFILYLDGVAASFAWGAVVRGRVEVNRIAYDPGFPSKLSVGKVANFYAVEECIRRGYVEFDLTRGGEMYKSWLGATPSKLLSVEIFRSRLDSLIQQSGYKVADFVRRQNWLKQFYRKYISR